MTDFTVVNNRKYAKIKQLNQKIIDLRELRTCGILTSENLLELNKKETKLIKIIEKL